MASEGSPGAERARKASERFRDSMEKVRTRTDTGVKALGGIASAAVVAVGYEKLANFYPDEGPAWAPWVLGAGVLLMLVAVGLFLRRFYRATQSVVTSANCDETKEGLGDCETEIIEKAYAAVAEANGASSLQELEARGRRLERCAEQTDDEQAERWMGQADRLLAEVQLAQDRAAAFILRRRATRPLLSRGTVLLIVLFVGGWYAMAVSADAMESERSEDDVEQVKECAEALKAVGFLPVKLPPDCNDAIEGADSKEVILAAKAALGDARKACKAAAESDKAVAMECEEQLELQSDGVAADDDGS